MGTFIEKCFGFYQVREELEDRISELEDENENLAVKISELENSNDQLWQAREKLTKANTELKTENQKLTTEKEKLTKEKTELTEKNKALTTEKDNLTKENTELKTENDKLNHQIIALAKEQDSLKYERAQLQDAHGFLEELCVNSEKDNQHLTDKLKKLESAQKNLENSNNQLLQAKEKIAEEKTEMEKEMARLKRLEATDKSELDLQNRRFKSAIEDLKRQNRKLEEENIVLKERANGLKEQLSKQPKPQYKEKFMVTPLQSLRLPISHPLVEILCDLSLKDKSAFNEKSPINFKKKVSEEDKIKFKQALRVLHAIVNNETSLRYLSDENQKFIEDLAQAEKITNELVEKTLEIISYSDVDVDFEAFENAMLEMDNTAVGLKSYSQSQLLDLDGGHWDLEVPSSPKESVTFRFDNLPKDSNGKEENFYARSSLKDLDKTGIIAIDFGTKSTTAIYMGEGGRYCLLSIGGDVDAVGLEKYENPTIVEFRNKEKFLKAYNALSHRPFTDKQDMEVAYEAQKEFADHKIKGNDSYRFFSQLKQWAGADEKQNFRDLFEDFSLESFAHCTDFNPIEIYAYYIGRCINNMHNGVFLKYFLSHPIKYEKHQAEKIRESFEKGLKKSLPRHVFDDDKTAKNFKVELRASEPCAYAISALKSYGFDKTAKLDKPIYYGVFDFGGGTTDFNFGKWEKALTLNSLTK
ncbi:hypothetical protein HpCK22_06450 [Helicobacter pylori]